MSCPNHRRRRNKHLNSHHIWSISMRRILIPAAILALGVAALPSPADDKKADDGFVQLFNGKDLTGWKIHPKANNAFAEIVSVEKDGKVTGYDAKLKKDGTTVHLWRVEDSILIGSGPASHLFSERDDYQNFYYRIEAMINDKGNSGQYFRTA